MITFDPNIANPNVNTSLIKTGGYFPRRNKTDTPYDQTVRESASESDFEVNAATSDVVTISVDNVSSDSGEIYINIVEHTAVPKESSSVTYQRSGETIQQHTSSGNLLNIYI